MEGKDISLFVLDIKRMR